MTEQSKGYYERLKNNSKCARQKKGVLQNCAACAALDYIQYEECTYEEKY